MNGVVMNVKFNWRKSFSLRLIYDRVEAHFALILHQNNHINDTLLTSNGSNDGLDSNEFPVAAELMKVDPSTVSSPRC